MNDDGARPRRYFLLRVAGASLATTATLVRARTSGPTRVIGYLSDTLQRPELARLTELGWVDGKNLRWEVRATNLEPEKYAVAAAELVHSGVDVLLSFLPPWVVALAAATRAIPIVCDVPDPVGLGIAESLRRPGRNVTGLSGGLAERSQMTIGLLKALRPRLRRIVSLHPVGASAEKVNRALAAAASAAGTVLDYAYVTNVADVERFFAAIHEPAAVAVIIGGPSHPDEIYRVIRKIGRDRRIAIVGGAREGALMDFALRHSDRTGRLASILDKVLRGANPAEIPFETPDRTVFVLNRATARAIGAQIPQEVLLRATTVIE